MANAKEIKVAHSTTGVTVQIRIKREADGFLLNDADGTFAAAPADSLVDLTEHATLKGLYEKSESRTAWDDGLYIVSAYISTDLNTIIASGEIDIVDDLESHNVDSISGDRVAVDNLEATYDGTGYSDDNAPSTQSQVSLLSTGSAAISIQAESYVLTTGTESSGGISDTETINSVRHEHTDDAGAMELYYQFDVGGAGVAVEVTITGRINGNNDDLDGVYAYNWAGASWDRIGDFEGQAGSTDGSNIYNLLVRHTGTGVNLGKVRIRFFAASGLSSATLRIDQIFTSFSIVALSVGYADGAIWVNTNASNTNTENFVDGVADNPVSTWAAALTLSSQLNITRFRIINGSAITLTGNSDHYSIIGQEYTLDFNGQSTVELYVFGGSISGTGTGNVLLEDCPIGNVILPPSIMRRCYLFGTITNSGVGDWFINHCVSRIAGTASPTFDFGTAVGNTNLNMRAYSGGIQLEAMGDTGTDTASIEGWGQVIEGTCTGGTVVIRGTFTISGITNLTLSDDARVDETQIADAVHNAVLSKTTYNIGQSHGKRIRQLGSLIAADASINDASPTDTSFVTTLTSTVDGLYVDQVLVIDDDTDLIGQSRVILIYDGTTKRVTVDEPFSQVPVDGSDIIIYSPHVHPVTQIADAVWDQIIETWSAEEVLRIMLAATAGKSTNGGKSFRDVADSKDRIAATTDGSGNRTSIILDGT